MRTKDQQLTLLDLNSLIKNVIAQSLPDNYWVIAEISEINEHTSGHCYLELIQKDELSDNIKAKAKATIWSYTYRMLKPYFETTTQRPLSRGMKVLINVQIVFHELFGYSLNIIDIEPSYTLGDIELQRRETINKLMADGVMEMNKELELDILPKHIAIISSPNAAGLQDFLNQLTLNQYGYHFECQVFPSIMQGDEAENSIINSLNGIYNSAEKFDVVVIVRGGGAQTDLSCFDSYLLASNIAQFPIPVVTGIGHDKDVSVADMVSYTSLKTPTAVAEFLINRFNDAELMAINLAEQLSEITNEKVITENAQLTNLFINLQYSCSTSLSNSKLNLEQLIGLFPYQVSQLIQLNRNLLNTQKERILLLSSKIQLTNKSKLEGFSLKIKGETQQLIASEKSKHELWNSSITNLNPDNILERGYSITLRNGKIVKSIKEIEIGDELTTKLKDGTSNSKVSSLKNKNK